MGGDGGFVDDESIGKGRDIVGRQHHVVGNRITEYQTVLLAVFGDVPHAGGDSAIGALTGDIRAGHHNRAVERLNQTGDGGDQLGLAVALHTSDAYNFATPNLERHIADGDVASLVGHLQMRDIKYYFTGCGRTFFNMQHHITTHHHAG